MALFKVNSPSILLKLPTFLVKPFVNFGYQEDNPQLFYKDYLFKDSPMATTSIMSEEISIKQYFKEVSNQYNIGSCTSNATADSVESQIILRKGVTPAEIPDLSRLFIYYNSRNLDTPPTCSIDGGAKIRFCFDSIRRHGVCKEATWGYDSSKINIQPNWLSYKEAIQNKITAFYRIETTDEDERFEQILKALNNKNPVVFGILLFNSFRSVKSDIIIQTSKNLLDDPILGNHAMVVTGWSKSRNCWELRNSWGTQFGVNGYCYMAKDYLLSFAKDIWVPTI